MQIKERWIMRTPDNKFLPMSCIAAMLVVTTTIVGLAYWVGDAMGPGFASVVGASVRSANAARPLPTSLPGIAASAANRAKVEPAAPAPAKRVATDAGR
jgi:hypothetical protein